MLFTNFEDIRLTDEEHVYLTAAAQGDVPIIRQSLDDDDQDQSRLNVNCVDYMGRSALHLAVDSDSIEAVELLLEKIDFDCVEESLRYAISKGNTKMVRTIVEHPSYIAGATAAGTAGGTGGHAKRTSSGYRTRSGRLVTGQKDPFFRTDEKSQFPPDITPLVLAAHYNNHEIIQLFLSRGHTVDRPHTISCRCADCVTKQNYDSLKRSRSRLNAYRALASPAYMALASPDPIMATFELRQEMKKLAQVEKEFKNEYLSLVEQCMIFACELMDLCRGTQEVEAVLSEGGDNGSRDPLARLKMAMEYEEKKFVAHPNCQQHLTSIYYGPEMGFLQSMSRWKKVVMWITCVPLVPFFCFIYIVSPHSKVGQALRCPASKFITHTLSHICFLILLAAATFRLDQGSRTISSPPSPSSFAATAASSISVIALPALEVGGDVAWNASLSASSSLSSSAWQQLPMSAASTIFTSCGNDTWNDKVEAELKERFRPANILMTNVQICLMFWILGLLWTECKQMYSSGMRVYLLDNYNWVDFIVLSFYLASYVLRFLVDHWIKQADKFYNGTERAREALLTCDSGAYWRLYQEIFTDKTHSSMSYFMQALRTDWKPDDPEIVSDVLFAVANVLSIARTTYLMPAFEVLGPLQVSLGRMLGDITRFLVLFTLVLFAFMVGLHNLYWYYGTQTYTVKKDGYDKLVHSSEAFQGLPRTLYSLFWSMFGLVGVDSVEIKYQNKDRDSQFVHSFPGGSHATSIVEGVGLFLFALYHVAIIIVLTNMLIAMMSHSFEAIQEDCDVEWKFARTKLWLNYIYDGSTLPVPFNMLPTPKSLCYAWRWVKELCDSDKADDRRCLENGGKRQLFIKNRREKVCQEMQIEMPHTSQEDILQRLVRRYLFKLERMKEEGKESLGVGPDSIVSGDLHGATTRIDKEPDAVGGTKLTGLMRQDSDTSIRSSAAGRPDFDSCRMTTSSGRHRGNGGGGGVLSLGFGGGLGSGASGVIGSNANGGSGGVQRRQVVMRPLGNSGRRQRAARPPSIVGGPGGVSPNQIQLISLPQLDLVQRSLKVLDVRVQRLHTAAVEEDKIRQDVEHILMVISENHKALSNVVAVLTSLQDEVHSLRETVRRQQSMTFHIQPPAIGGHASATSPGSQSGSAGGGAYYGPAVTHQGPAGSSSTMVRGGGHNKRSHEGRHDSIILSLGSHGDKPLRH